MDMGDRIKELRILNGWSQEELGERLGLKRAAINKYETGSVENIKRSTIQKMADIFGVSPAYLLAFDDEEENETKKVEVRMIPLVGKIPAGEPILAEENIERYIPVISTSIKNDGIYFFLDVVGDSMNLEFQEGSKLLLEKDADYTTGDIAAVRINGNDATVKKVAFDDRSVTLIPMSNNPEHRPKTYYKDEIDICFEGKVVQVIKEY